METREKLFPSNVENQGLGIRRVNKKRIKGVGISLLRLTEDLKLAKLCSTNCLQLTFVDTMV
jgi:hypothetical protein